MMQAQWTLVVEGLGRIERAEVRLHPFMLFVGENNSGKSYLASLLWGLASRREDFLVYHKGLIASPAFIACNHWLNKRLERRAEEPEYTLTPEDCQVFLAFWNAYLAEQKDLIVSRIFNVPAMKVSRLEIRDLKRHSPLTIRWSALGLEESEPFLNQLEQEPSRITFPVSSTNRFLPGTTDKEERVARYIVIQMMAWRVVMDGISQTLPLSWDQQQRIGDPLYFPASRTGFMLLHKAVVRRQIGMLLETDRTQEQLQLTRPAIQFLDLLAVGMRPTDGGYRDEADFLEQHSLQGRLELNASTGGNEFQYHPGGTSPALPMALSSSLVTELAPVILALRHIERIPVLILEEPEAHLHPRIQRILAQTLVRLVRKGVKVWVTTHSENFCQQIDNFLKLGQLPNRTEVARQLGYEEQDYLELSEVTGYQFVNRGTGSMVSELEKSPAGLTMPTFNDELLKLAQQTVFLQRAAAKSNDEA